MVVQIKQGMKVGVSEQLSKILDRSGNVRYQTVMG